MQLHQTAAPLQNRTALVRQASYTALIGNMLLCTAKLIAGFLSGSLAVIGDGLDSGSDTIIALMAVIVSFIINVPSDENHPWGHQRAETIASVIVSFLIMLAGVQLFLAAGKQLFLSWHSTVPAVPQKIAVIVSVFSIAGKLLLALNQYALGKKAQSLMVLANARNMLNDIVISAGVLLGFTLSMIFHIGFIDSLIALLVSCWIIKSAIELFIELNIELMDGTANRHIYHELFEAVNTVPSVKNPHRARIRKMANLWDIDLDIEVDGNLSVFEAHTIAEQVSSAIKQKLDNVYDVMIHVEPYNSDRSGESYGLSPKNITN
ncbi:MAG: cation diffusion facilitator family transporter [Treponema sp.]